MKNNYIKLILIFLLSAAFNLNAQNEWERYDCDYNKHHFHHVALFSGSTSWLDNSEHYFTLAGEYMYSPRNWDRWSLSAITEIIFKEHYEFVIAFPAVYRANEHVWLRFGLGAEFVRDNTDKLIVNKEPLIRIGGGYDFHWKFLTLSPTMDIDIVRNHPAAVIGLNIGYAF